MVEEVLNDAFWDEEINRLDGEEPPGQSFGPFEDPVIINVTKEVEGAFIGRLVYKDGGLDQDDIHRSWLRKVGFHWNLVQAEGMGGPVGCPRDTYGESCVVCDAADELIATGRATKADLLGFKAQNKWTSQAKWLVRFLLLKFVPHGTCDIKLEQPILRYFPVPWRVRLALHEVTKGSEYEGLMSGQEARKRGRETLFSWDGGKLIKISKGRHIDKTWAVDIVGDPFPIPEQFRNHKMWPSIDECLPDVHSEKMEVFVSKHRRDIPELVAQSIERMSAITIEGATQAALPDKTVSVDEVNTAPSKDAVADQEEAQAKAESESKMTSQSDLEARLAAI